MSRYDGEAEIVFTKHGDGHVTYEITEGGHWVRVSTELIKEIVELRNNSTQLASRVNAVLELAAHNYPTAPSYIHELQYHRDDAWEDGYETAVLDVLVRLGATV